MNSDLTTTQAVRSPAVATALMADDGLHSQFPTGTFSNWLPTSIAIKRGRGRCSIVVQNGSNSRVSHDRCVDLARQ